MAAVALAGIFSQIAVDDPFATGGSEQAHTQQLPNPGLPGAVGLPPGISIETPGRPVQGPNVPDAQANPVQENASKLSGNFSVKQAENVLDAAGDGQIGDLSYQFKIEKSGKIGWGTFDWSHANGLKSVGINLFDENNPSLNGDARWQLTMLAAKSLGVPVETLNTVYAGDTFNIKITPELAQKLIDLNVKVPDNILKSVGLLTATTAAQPDSKPVVAAPVTTEKHDDAVNLLPGSTGGNGSAGSVTSGSGNAGSVSGGFGSSLTTSIQAFLEQVQKNKVDLAPAALTPAADQFKLTDAEKANAYKVFEIRDNVNGPAQVLVSKLDNPEVGKVLFVGNRSILQIFENYQSQGLNIPLVQNTTAKLSSGFMDFSFRDPQTNNSYDLISRGFQALTLDKPEPVTTPVPTPTVVPQETGLKQGYKASALEKTDNGRVLKAIDESTGKTVEMNFDDKNLDKLDQMVKVSAGNHNLPVEFMMTEQRGVKGISFKNLDQKFIFVPFWQEENKDDDELDWLSFFTDSEKAFGQEIPAAKTIAISLAGILGISTISIYMTLRAAAKRRQEEEDEKVRAGSRVAAGGLA
ncbi:hypothetical protein HY024_03695 [Candidatus Curtissbacteria bacterium]|nr:hypothetical protein [Candidatus Curtissbacteria bacterium]